MDAGINGVKGVRWIFIGENGLRHGWRFSIFAATVILGAQFLEEPALGFLGRKLHLDRALSATNIIISDLFDLVIILVVTGVFARFERRRIDGYGLPVSQAFGNFFWNGALLGMLAIQFVGLGMLLTRGMRLRGVALHGAEMITAPFLWLLAMLLVGIAEEYVFRGYALQSLWRAAGFWPAVLITSGLFAGAHISKPHENAIDIGMIFVLGVLL